MQALRGRGALLLAVRFALAAALLAAALVALEPVVFGALGRAARDLVVVSTAEPLVTGVTWRSPTFLVTSPLPGGTLGLTAPWFRVALVLPLALALALPGGLSRARLAVCGVAAAAIFAASVLALANDVLAALVERLAGRGLSVLPQWRMSLHVVGRDAMWEVAMVYLPAATCLLVSLPFVRLPSGDGATARGSTRRRRIVTAVALGTAVVLALAADRVASARIERLEPEALLRAIEPWNPDLGGFLVRAGEGALARDHADEAIRIFRLALRYEASAGAAAEGLRRAHERAAAAAEAKP